MCGPHIEVEIEVKHRAKREWPRRDLVGEWQAKEREDLLAVEDAVTAQDLAELRPAARGARRAVEAKARVKRVLTFAQQAEVHALLVPLGPKGKVRRAEWESEVWLELLNPTITVQKTETGRGRPLGLARRVAKAVERAHKNTRTYHKETVRMVSLPSEDVESEAAGNMRARYDE